MFLQNLRGAETKSPSVLSEFTVFLLFLQSQGTNFHLADVSDSSAGRIAPLEECVLQLVVLYRVPNDDCARLPPPHVVHHSLDDAAAAQKRIKVGLNPTDSTGISVFECTRLESGLGNMRSNHGVFRRSRMREMRS